MKNVLIITLFIKSIILPNCFGVYLCQSAAKPWNNLLSPYFSPPGTFVQIFATAAPAEIRTIYRLSFL